MDDDGSLQWLDLKPLGEYKVGVVSLARVHIYPDGGYRSLQEEVRRERTSSLKPAPKVRWTLALQPGRVVLYVCIQSTVFHLHRYPDRRVALADAGATADGSSQNQQGKSTGAMEVGVTTL